MEYRSISEWTFEQAQQDQENTAEADSARQPIFRFFAFRELEIFENQYKATNSGYLVLEAVRKCANHDIALPNWLSRAFISRFDLIRRFQVGSWDDAFDRPIPKGAHLHALRIKRSLQFQVLGDAREILAMDPTQAIDKSLFEAVGKLHNLGATKAEEFYYSAKRMLGDGGRSSTRRVLVAPRSGKSRK